MLIVHVHSALFMTAISFGVEIIAKIVTKNAHEISSIRDASNTPSLYTIRLS